MKIQIRYSATPVAKEKNYVHEIKNWIQLIHHIAKAIKKGAFCIYIYPDQKKPVVETTGETVQRKSSTL